MRGSDLPEELQRRQHRLEHTAEADTAALEAIAEAVSQAEQEIWASPAVVYFSRYSTPAKLGWAAHLRRLAQRLAMQRVGRYIFAVRIAFNLTKKHLLVLLCRT
jgi:hypothetical protein